ncbi:single-stranded DNA-binding protein [Paraburkholderia sp. BR10872]|uniref:single-stranded DNA-binding protein n=1 Tax=Paraburkholderia sp. BR10872 TaxID=3236989 RepID=UPI0034D187D0
MTANRARLTINRQMLLGELAADVESRSMPSGDALVNLRVITYGEVRDRTSGELREIPETHRVAVFGKPAEELRSLKKGEIVYVEGRTRTRKHQPAGAVEAKYFTEIAVSAFEGRCLRWADAAAQTSAQPQAEASRTPPGTAAGAGPLDDERPY